MLEALEFSVTFPTTGRTIEQKIQFQTGLGAITGANESGKSLSIEMIRFALFGSQALRAELAHYKTLKVQLTFRTRGKLFKVRRTTGSARLYEDQVEKAVGTTAVNNKIVDILGYGLPVFDVANVANQNDLEKLGNMRPTERKRLVDSVIGLSVIEDLAKWAGDEALARKRSAEDQRANLVQPTAPVKPENYEDPMLLGCLISEMRDRKSELDQINGWLSRPMPEPKRPDAPAVTMTAEEIAAGIEKLDEKRLLQTQLRALPQHSGFSEEELLEMEQQWTQWDQWQRRERFLAMHEKPVISKESIEQQLEQNAHWVEHETREALIAKIAKLRTQGTHQCPACAHTWAVAQTEIEVLETALAALPAPRVVVKPTLSVRQLDQQRAMHEDWDAHAEAWAELEPIVQVKKPQLTRSQIDDARRANSGAASRGPIEEKLVALKDLPDYEGIRQQMARYEMACGTYMVQHADYLDHQRERAAKEIRKTELLPLVATLPNLEALLTQVQIYDLNQKRYETDVADYDRRLTVISELEQESADWKKAKEACAILRVLIKQHLLPSLNTVASLLISQMTGGQRSKIVVNDDFEIMVDDQPIQTLSGSGMAVANLSLRLGLGQVLTNGVFSVFMGDEIDASCDADRAAGITTALSSLKSRIAQMVLVTHKEVAADYHIRVGG